jgi:hypothetical protein
MIDEIFEDITEETVAKENESLDIPVADNPNNCDGYQYMMMINFSNNNTDKLDTLSELIFRDEFLKLLFSFRIICPKATGLIYNSIANKPIYDEYNKKTKELYEDIFRNYPVYEGEIDDVIADFIKPSWYEFRRTIFIKFSLQKCYDMRTEMNIICRLFTVICDVSSKYPYFFKNVDGHWTQMYKNYISVCSYINLFWKDARPYKKSEEYKVIFFTLDFFHSELQGDERIKFIRKLSKAYKGYSMERWKRIKAIGEE